MSDSRLFAVLEPPPGGRARLRARLAEARQPPSRAWVWQPAVVVLLAVVAIGGISFLGGPTPTSHDPVGMLGGDPSLVALGLVPPPPDEIRGLGDTAVAPVERHGAVSVYLVATLATPRAEPR